MCVREREEVGYIRVCCTLNRLCGLLEEHRHITGSYPAPWSSMAADVSATKNDCGPDSRVSGGVPHQMFYWSNGTDYVLWSPGSDGMTDAIWKPGGFSDLDRDTVIANGHEVQLFEGRSPCSCVGGYRKELWDLVRDRQADIKREAAAVPF